VGCSASPTFPGETTAGCFSKYVYLEVLQAAGAQESRGGCQQLVKGVIIPLTKALTPLSFVLPSLPLIPSLARKAMDGRKLGISTATIVTGLLLYGVP
jgi:hypothetical protein